jgi:hypothetical protein
MNEKRDSILLRRVVEMDGSWDLAVSFGVGRLLIKDKRVDPSKYNNRIITTAFCRYNDLLSTRILLQDDRVIKQGIPFTIQQELIKQTKQSQILHHLVFNRIPNEIKNIILDFLMIQPYKIQ